MRRRELLVNEDVISPDGITYKYVDMGLSVKWATFNIGATKIGEYGKYFQWGDTQGYTSAQLGSGAGKKYFSWSDYKYRASGSTDSDVKFSKYNTNSSYGTVDNKTVLESSDDAATFNMGTGWRMPTKDEYEELMNACNQTWDSTNKCRIFTLKTDNSKQIAFPLPGEFADGSVYNVNNGGFHWTSTLKEPNCKNAYKIDLYSTGGSMGFYTRNHGYPIRGVHV